jgi:hypothetical protein
VFDWSPTCAYADMHHTEIERRDSTTRVRAPRSASDESALTVRAALAGDGFGYYSRRRR